MSSAERPGCSCTMAVLRLRGVLAGVLTDLSCNTSMLGEHLEGGGRCTGDWMSSDSSGINGGCVVTAIELPPACACSLEASSTCFCRSLSSLWRNRSFSLISQNGVLRWRLRGEGLGLLLFRTSGVDTERAMGDPLGVARSASVSVGKEAR
eukprot:scaffold4719_cov29-Tisochrysis_lutea.AAC.2